MDGGLQWLIIDVLAAGLIFYGIWKFDRMHH